MDSTTSVKSGLKKERGLKQGVMIGLLLLAVGAIMTSAYFYRQYSVLKANPNLEAEKETATLLREVGALIELPTDEIPTIATVQDIEKLKDQAFFSKAQNGDKLLAFTGTRQAILYRPSIHKIINVASITIDETAQVSENVTAAPLATDLKVAYYNGTETIGLSAQAESKVKELFPEYETVVLASATNKNYTETVVIDVSGSYAQEAEALANALGGKVVTLPEGETKPEADLLIISGQ